MKLLLKRVVLYIHTLTKLSGPAFGSSRTRGPAGTWRWSEIGRQHRLRRCEERSGGTGVPTTTASDPDQIYVNVGNVGMHWRLHVNCNVSALCLRSCSTERAGPQRAPAPDDEAAGVVWCVLVFRVRREDSPCADAWRGRRIPAPSAHVARLWSPGFSYLCSSDQVSMGLHSWYQ